MNENLTRKIKDLPEKPGVYIMKDKDGHILYIGKARSLKNRVRQYFNSPKNKTTKVLIMVSKIENFEYIITRNEIEALVLENNLIKQHKPPYNILLKDDKNYPFVRINLKEAFPRVEVVRKLKKDGSKYFGPYMQGITSKDILELINSAFCLRTCKLNMDKLPKNHRPCLNSHIDRCMAPCAGTVTREEYHDVLLDVMRFLNGNDKEIQRILTEKMNKASADTDYELAIFYRDKLKVLDKLVRKQVTALPGDINMDIFAITSNGINTVVSVLNVRGGKLLGGAKETVDDASLELSTMLGNYIVNYYQAVPIAGDIVTNLELEDKGAIEEFLGGLSGEKVNIVLPIQGVRRQLVDMAESNALDYLEKCVSEETRKYNMTMGGVKQLQDALNLDSMPYRIECYDISHISGTNKVASMVVFTNGVKDAGMYRKFRIKTVEGNNDFACMEEVLNRRFGELEKNEDLSFSKRPDLIVIDGGLGQLAYVQKAVDAHKSDIKIISLAKREEEVFVMGSETPIILDRRSYALMLLQRIRDEAHRFAITFHKHLRGKKLIESELSEIKGIGKERIKALYKHFKTYDAMKAAELAEFEQIEGMNKPSAKRLYEYFRDYAD